jgi:hypothetical protein
MEKPAQLLVSVSRINEAPHDKPHETFSAHSVEVTEDGSLSIRGQDTGRFLTPGLWDGLEVKLLSAPPTRHRPGVRAYRQDAWAGDWFD